MTFSALVNEAARTDPAVRRYLIDLKEFADLRNAIVHERGTGEVIAEPHEEAVETLESIFRKITDPPRIDRFLKEVLTSTADEPIGVAAGLMRAGDFSQVPVYLAGTMVALLTAETIARWVAAAFESGVGLVEEESIGIVLTHTEDEENHA